MHISAAVLSGGVRRSASIALFSPNDTEMAQAKTGSWFTENPQRSYSNNSAVLLREGTQKQTFDELMEYVKEFGEPGFFWTDSTEQIPNPCVEIGMWPVDEESGQSGWQMCNLSTINGKNIHTLEDFEEAALAATIIGTCQAGYTDFDYLGSITEKIVRREALIGVSITGIMDNPDIILNPAYQKHVAQQIKNKNKEIADKIGIRQAARTTCLKPEGTASCLLGTSSGIHPHHARRYLRRVQANKMEHPAAFFRQTNPIAVEESVYNRVNGDLVLNFCIEVEHSAKTKNQIDALSMLGIVRDTYINWVQEGKNESLCTQSWLSHNVSNTIHVKDDEWAVITDFIYSNRQYFAGIALLPIHGDLDYSQAPFTKVNTPDEILEEYGGGALLAGGMIEYALNNCDNDLWKACDIALGKNTNEESGRWAYKLNRFAGRYFKGDKRKACYCLKEVYNFKKWLDIRREHKDIDYTQMIETENGNKFEHTAACGGGTCDINI